MAGGAERTSESSRSGDESPNVIKKEQELLFQELRFFTHHENNGAVGILTTSDLRFISQIYPKLSKEMLGIYAQLTTPEITESAQENYIEQYLSASLMRGELVTDEQARKLLDKVKEGDHALQVAAYAKHERSLQKQQQRQRPQTSRNYFGYDEEDEDDEDIEPSALNKLEQQGTISFKKGQIMSVQYSMDSALESLYGEVDYKGAFLAEMLLQAPFMDAVTSPDAFIDDAARKRHLAYIEAIKSFVDTFDADSRLQAFDQITQQYVPDNIEETKPLEFDDFDKSYVKKVYEFAKSIQECSYSLDDLYELFRQTLFRRGKHFVISISERGLRMVPKPPEEASFDDIVGYSEQTAYFKNLLRRTAENHRSMNNVRLILLASKPGLGKTLTITAFFNDLPENARGIVFDHKAARRRGVTSVMGEFAELARLHPDLHIFAGIEDINTNEYFEDELLDVESIIPGNFPQNLHVIATTNYLEGIPSALLRPGRASEILIYTPTRKSSERAGIIRVHARKHEVTLTSRAINIIANRTGGFTPDELAHVVRTVSFELSEDTSNSEIDRIITKIKERRNLAKKIKRSLKEGLLRRT